MPWKDRNIAWHGMAGLARHMRRTRAALLAATLACAPFNARSSPPAAPTVEPVTLAMSARHRLTVNGTPTSRQALVTTLSRITNGDHERPIILHLHPSLPYGQLVELMGRLLDAGYTRVSVATPR